MVRFAKFFQQKQNCSCLILTVPTLKHLKSHLLSVDLNFQHISFKNCDHEIVFDQKTLIVIQLRSKRANTTVPLQ